MTGAGQTIVNDFKAAVEAAKITAKDAAGTVGSDFAEIMGIVDGYVAVVPKALNRAETAWAKVKAFIGGILKRIEDLFQMLDGPNGKFSSKRAVFVLAAVLGAIEFLRERWFPAAGCGVVVALMGLWIAWEDVAYIKAKKAASSISPQAIPGMPAEGIVTDYGGQPIPGQFLGKVGP